MISGKNNRTGEECRVVDESSIPDDFDDGNDGQSSVHSDTTYDDEDVDEDDDEGDDVCDDGKPDSSQPSSSSGMANVMAKLLAKTVSGPRGPILCKAKTERQLAARKRKMETSAEEVIKVKVTEAQNDDDDNDEKVVEIKDEKKIDVDDTETRDNSDLQARRKAWEDIGRVKPNQLEREKERNLQRIATKGVVQLFNAVKKQQSELNDEKLNASSSSTSKSATRLRGRFLDMLQEKKSRKKMPDVEMKTEPEEDKEMTWSILRDDFMLGSNMKDWNKETDDS